MLAERLRKFIDENGDLFGIETKRFLDDVYGSLRIYERRAEISAPPPKMTVNAEQAFLEQEVFNLMTICLNNAKIIIDNNKVNCVFVDQLRLAEIMIGYISNRQKISSTTNLVSMMEDIFGKKSMVPFPGPIVRGNQGKCEIREKLLEDENFVNSIVEKVKSDTQYGQHEERLINSDDFLNETPDVTKSSVAMLQRTLTEESGDSISMEVLCYDEMGKLHEASTVRRVLFVREHIADYYYVIRIVKEAVAGGPITECGLLIN